MSLSQSNYDSPWKEAMDIYFEPFVEFFFPQAYSEINWSRNYESLDTELQEIIRDAETGWRLADKLVKVWLKNGQETIVLIHTEYKVSMKQILLNEYMFIIIEFMINIMTKILK